MVSPLKWKGRPKPPRLVLGEVCLYGPHRRLLVVRERDGAAAVVRHGLAQVAHQVLRERLDARNGLAAGWVEGRDGSFLVRHKSSPCCRDERPAGSRGAIPSRE